MTCYIRHDSGRRLWRRMRRGMILAVALAGIGGGGLHGPHVALLSAAEPADADPLATVNAAFREQYAVERQQTLAQGGPILLLMGDTLTLLKDGEREQADISPAEYRNLKAIDHAALGADLHLSGLTRREMTAADRERISRYRQQVQAVFDALDQYDFSTAGTDLQAQILTRTLAILDDALNAATCPADRLQTFTRDLAPLLLTNADAAARLQIDALQAQVQAWRAKLSADDWQRLRAIVVGSQLPRRGALGVQYFARVLGEPGEGRRVIYAEALFDEERALRLAGTHALDRQIGIAFFNDDERMHRDLLADATEHYLQELFPRATKPASETDRRP